MIVIYYCCDVDQSVVTCHSHQEEIPDTTFNENCKRGRFLMPERHYKGHEKHH